MSEAERDAAHVELMQAIIRHGGRVPCLVGDLLPVAFWTDDDPERQGLAAQACRGCPAIAACRNYGLTWPDEAGAYGGLTDSERRRGAQQRRETA